MIRVLPLALLAACGGAPNALRTTIDVAATSLVQTDNELAIYVSAAAHDCVEASSDWDEYDDCTEDWRAVETALLASRSTLLALEEALDAWDAGGEEAYPRLAGCAASALLELATALTIVDVDMPEELVDVLATVGGFAGECRE